MNSKVSSGYTETTADNINRNDKIFESLRDDYPGFDKWWNKCICKKRICWVVMDNSQIAGLIVLKKGINEGKKESIQDNRLKISTFKVAEDFRGFKLGEFFLRKISWYVQENGYSSAYLTAFDDQTELIQFINDYGFKFIKKARYGQSEYEKKFEPKCPERESDKSEVQITKENYPRFLFDKKIKGIGVPISTEILGRLFPELDNSYYSHIEKSSIAGNAIKKEHIIQTKLCLNSPGSIILFYLFDEDSNSSTEFLAIGILEDSKTVSSTKALIGETSERSAFSEIELRSKFNFDEHPSIEILSFYLTSYIDPTIPIENCRELDSKMDAIRRGETFEIGNTELKKLMVRSNLNFEL